MSYVCVFECACTHKNTHMLARAGRQHVSFPITLTLSASVQALSLGGRLWTQLG